MSEVTNSVRVHEDIHPDSSDSTHPSILESPWYWVQIFCVAAICALVLMGPRFSGLQSDLERDYQGRRRAMSSEETWDPQEKLSTDENTMIGLTPLFVLAGVGFAFSWVMVWRQHFWKRNRETAPAGSNDKHTDENPPTPALNNEAAS